MRKPTAVFLGVNGYPGEAEKAKEHLEAGRRYTVQDASVGRSSSTLKIKGRIYNTVMFSIRTDTLVKHFGLSFYLPGLEVKKP